MSEVIAMGVGGLIAILGIIADDLLGFPLQRWWKKRKAKG